MNKSNISWDQAFQEVNEAGKRHECLNMIANKLYPRTNGVPRVDFIGLSSDQRDNIYGEYVSFLWDKE